MSNESDDNNETNNLVQWLFEQKKVVNPIFSKALIDRHRIINFVPLHQKLQKSKNEQQQIGLLITNALFSINKLFKEKNIPLIHLKGPVLSYRLYKDFTKRCYVDLDLLIQEQDIDTAIAVLQGLNYRIKGGSFRTIKQKKVYLQNFHHLTFHNQENNCFVELHWKLAASRFISIDFQRQVWHQVASINFANTDFQVLNEIDEFIYLCIHGSRHSFERLSWLVDVHHYIQQHDKQFLAEVIAKATTYKLATYIFHALYLLKEFGIHFPLPPQKTDSKSVKLCNLSIKLLNNKQAKNLLSNFILYYKTIITLHGFKGVLIEMNTRRYKPNNWNFVYFPDRLFFLNQLLSRPIWILRKLAQK